MTANAYSGSIYTLPQLVDVVKRNFQQKQDSYPRLFQNAPYLVKDPKGRNTGNSTLYAERIITDRYAGIRVDGESTPISPLQYGYEKPLIVNSITEAVNISYGLRTFGRLNDALDQMQILIEAPQNKLELDLANRLTYAWDTSYTDNRGNTIDVTMGDGLAKISTVHTVTGSASTFSTQVPANPAFSKGGLVAAKKIIQRNTIDNLGVNINSNPKVIVSSDDEDTCLAIKELLNATADVTSTNSNTYNNYTNASYQHISSALVCTSANGSRDTTKEKYWFLCDDKLASMYLTVVTSPYYVTPQLGMNTEDPLSGSALFTSGMDYGICEVSARGWAGSKGTGV